MRVTVQVTQEDIDNGRYANCCNCPVALAMQRTLGRMVYIGSVRAVLDVENKDIMLPGAVRRFIYDFDQRREQEHDDPKRRQWVFQPFSFEVEVPE